MNFTDFFRNYKIFTKKEFRMAAPKTPIIVTPLNLHSSALGIGPDFFKQTDHMSRHFICVLFMLTKSIQLLPFNSIFNNQSCAKEMRV